MLIVPSRPLLGPIERSGGWYDDFSKTGTKNPRYTVSGKVITENGVGIEAPGNSTSASIALPMAHAASYVDFIAEWVYRTYGSPSASTEVFVSFRYTNANNRIYVTKLNNSIRLTKATGGVFTTLINSGAIFTSTNWHKVRIRAFGSRLELFVDDKFIGGVTETDHLRVGGVASLNAYDPSNGVAKGEWQYLAIKPIGN